MMRRKTVMKATLPRLWRLTRRVSIVVGLAVMLALVAGVASLAVAKPPSGGDTAATAFLVGAKNTANALTTLVNNGSGPALRLEVSGEDPNKPAPFEVNSNTLVKNLHAETADTHT